jgi:flagellin
MSMAVNNNSSAFSIWTSFSANSANMGKAMNHLSTGVKGVNDNPSGVGISERMRSQARNVSAARSNVENSLSMLQTADSWMQKMSDMLGRMSELAIEAGDGTKTQGDKDNIQIEFKELQHEIARITSKSTAAAKFNGLYLFRGGDGLAIATGDGVGTGNISVQIGPDTEQTVTLNLKDLQVSNTEVIGSTISYTYNASNIATGSTRTSVQWSSIVDSNKLSVTVAGAVGKIAKAIDFLSNARANNGAQQNKLEQTRSGLLSYEDNLRAAESKIRDVDMAKESTTFAKYQILNQVSNAMLAQANQLPQQVLQLIG